MLEDILKTLPSDINTSILVVSILMLWKLSNLVLNVLKKKKEVQKSFEKEVLEKERERSKFNSRLVKVEEEIISIRMDFDKKNIENKEDILILSRKIDKILDILIKPLK